MSSGTHNYSRTALRSAAIILAGTATSLTTRAGIAQAELPPAVVADYARQYTGMGFDEATIKIFARVQLTASDYRDLARRLSLGVPRDVAEKRSRILLITGARNAEELGFAGKQAVADVTCISDKEMSLLRQYKSRNDDPGKATNRASDWGAAAKAMREFALATVARWAV